MLTYREFAKYGTATTFMFALEDVTDVEAPFVGVAPLTADIWISKDGGAAANATNAFTAVSNGIYTWAVTATEMQATRLLVNVYDATAAAIFRPISIVILTKLQLGQVDVDATQIGGNVTAMILQGVGTGSGLLGTGGATGDGIEGVGGATSGYGIKTTATATNEYNNLLDVTEGTEPASAIGNNATLRRILQSLKRRMLNKVTATTTQLKVFADDSATVIETQTNSNDGTTQTVGKSA